MQLNTISDNNNVAHRVTTQPSNALSGAFQIQHLIAGSDVLLLKKYSCFLREQPDQKTLTNLPQKLEGQLITVTKLAEFERRFMQLLQSKKTDTELLKFPFEKQSFRSLLLQLKKQFDTIEMTTQSSARLSPLLNELKRFMDTHFQTLPSLRFPCRPTSAALQDLKTLREALPRKGSLLNKYADKSNYERERDDRIRNCNKRRKSAYENIQWLTKHCRQPLVIHLAFETKRPFDSLACNAKFQTARPTHFVNNFLALRNKSRYKKTLFKGLKGYFRKLEVMDLSHAYGGFITLVFDQSKIEREPYELGQHLVSLLAKMSPDDDINERGQFRYVFQSNTFVNPNYKNYQSILSQQWIKELTAVVNYYTHADYFLGRFKHPDEKAYYQGNLPQINPYSSGICR